VHVCPLCRAQVSRYSVSGAAARKLTAQGWQPGVSRARDPQHKAAHTWGRQGRLARNTVRAQLQGHTLYELGHYGISACVPAN
jgi:hypothetical protein